MITYYPVDIKYNGLDHLYLFSFDEQFIEGIDYICVLEHRFYEIINKIEHVKQE